MIDEIGPADPAVILFEGTYYFCCVQLPGFRIHVRWMKTSMERMGTPAPVALSGVTPPK